MSRELRYNALRSFFWVAVTGLNGGMFGWDLAAGSRHAWFSGGLGVLCLILAASSLYDLWFDWQDERYERKYLASLEPPVWEEINLDSRNVDPFNKAE